MTDAAASMDMLKGARRVMTMLGEAINLVYNIYEDDFYDL